mmetsp:Transcript_16448/g.36999  ORF Transcript_16448/g.36999 Transcript_16448/m.36999 type:complete len:331 (-) Transcript_16448:13-1005(-)
MLHSPGLDEAREQRRVNLVQQPKATANIYGPGPDQRRLRHVPPASLEEALVRSGYHLPALEQTEELVLNAAGVHMDTWAGLSYLLCRMQCLALLDLSRNALGLEWAEALAQGLQHVPRLRTLRLNSCSIIDLGAPLGLPGPKARSAFEEALQAVPFLKVLQLAGNQLGPGTAVALASAVRRVTNLEELHLQQNRLGPDGAKVLLPLLQWTSGLKELQLGRNFIGAEGIEALGDALPKLPDLEVLGLECNELGEEGAKVLARAFMRHRVLTTLDVSWNEMGMEGLRALAKPLKLCSQLYQLRLGGNGLDPAAEREMTLALRRVHSPAIGSL